MLGAVTVVGAAPVPERRSTRSSTPPAEPAEPAPPAEPTEPAPTSSPSASIRTDSNLRPPSTKNSIAAMTVLTARLEKKIVSGVVPSPASSITELVMVP